MDAEILAIGSELLLGETIDTNSAYLARGLAAAGVNVFRKAVVGDNQERIATAIAEALGRVDLVICTGGLGPTVDDVTREAVAQATGRPLEFQQELMDQITARFAAFQRPMSASNRRQAYIPQGARAIHNTRGTAPAFIVEDAQGTVIVLPGVPHEMRFLFETAVIPYLRQERGIRDVILVRTLHAIGQGESVIGERIADLMQSSNPTLGISAKNARYELRIGARADSLEAAETMIAALTTTLQDRLGELLLGSEPLSQEVGRLLSQKQLSLALFEGHMAAPIYHALSEAPIALERLLGVIIHPLDSPTDETAALALAHAGAVNAQNRWRSDLGLGMEFVAQPDASGFTTVCISLVFPGGNTHITQHYDLQNVEGWNVVGTLALNTLRTYILEI